MTAAIEPRANLPALTGIRGIAAWYVVLFHIRIGAETQLGPTVTSVLAKGYLAVDLFFLLSGFVLWLNYADRLRGRGAGAGILFLARRLARIWPLHMFILGWAVIFAVVLALTGRASPERFPWTELPFHLLLVQNWGFTEALTWNEPAWSISCEWAAYLLFPLLVGVADWRRMPSLALVLLLMLLAVTLHLVMASGAAGLGDDIPRFGLARALTEFTMGTILCSLWTRWRDRPFRPVAASLAIVTVLTPAALAGLLPETLAVPPILAALLLVLSLTASSRRNPLGWRWIHYLGEISYATYLVHFLLYILFKILFVEDAAAVPLPLLGAFLVLVLAASVALHHMVERPAQRALNRAIDMVPGPAPASA